jgi:hypothetical protein
MGPTMESTGTTTLLERRNRRLLTVLRILAPASLMGVLSTTPSFFLGGTMRAVGIASFWSLSGLFVAYVVAYAITRTGRFNLARSTLFTAWITYGIGQLVLYRPDFEEPVMGTLYITIATAFMAMMIVGVAALEVFPERWVGSA